MTDFFCPDSEDSVLSAMVQKEEFLCAAIEELVVEDFYFQKNQTIFNALVCVYKTHETTGLEKLLIELKKNGSELVASDLQSMLAKTVLAKEDLDYYIQSIKRNSILRQIKEACNQINRTLLRRKTPDAQELLEQCRQMFHAIDDVQNGELGKDFKTKSKEQALPALRDLMLKVSEKGECAASIGLTSGISSLDEIIGGFGPGHLITIAARPGIGKTAIALNVSAHIISKYRKPVYFFSLEMTYKELSNRMFSILSGVENWKIKKGTLSKQELAKIEHEVGAIQENCLIVNDMSGLRLGEIISKAKRAKEKYDISAVVVDYLQHISGGKSYENRYLEVSDITRQLKILARDLSIPVIALSQFSRKAEERTNHSATLSDLKESGSIEQDSDVVIGLNRRDAYDSFDRPGEVQITVLKNRHGPVGHVNVNFVKETGVFKDKHGEGLIWQVTGPTGRDM